MKVAVFGSRGRMGAEVCRAVEAADGLDLVAAVDVGDDRAPVEAAEVVVDFTHPDAVMDNLAWCIDHGIHAVVGTTGFTDERLDALRTSWPSSPEVGVLVAANFSIGAVLMMHFAEQAAALLRERRDHRAAPSRQGRRAVRHGRRHRPPDRRRPGGRGDCPRRPMRRCRSCPAPGGRPSTASGCTASGCAGWSPTRRCCSAPRGRP